MIFGLITALIVGGIIFGIACVAGIDADDVFYDAEDDAEAMTEVPVSTSAKTVSAANTVSLGFASIGTVSMTASGVLMADRLTPDNSQLGREAVREFRKQQYSHIDSEFRPHREDGPVTEYGVKWIIEAQEGRAIPHRVRVSRQSAYFWHGVQVPQWMIEERDTITVREIERQANAEVRRAAMEMYLGKDYEADGLDGVARYIRDCKAELLDADKRFGRLWQKTLPPTQDGWREFPAETVTMVEVENSTVEKDGSRKRYFLRVPNDMRTARQAVAWTWGMKSKDYCPAKET